MNIMKLEMQKVLLPPPMLEQAKLLVVFDKGDSVYRLLLFNFGEDGGGIGIWREGDDFCARITLDALAEFADVAKATYIEGRA